MNVIGRRTLLYDFAGRTYDPKSPVAICFDVSRSCISARRCLKRTGRRLLCVSIFKSNAALNEKLAGITPNTGGSGSFSPAASGASPL